MGETRDEALRIGQEVAEKVIKSARGCRCGIALWDARGALSALNTIVTFEESKLLQPLPQFMASILTVAQKECGVDMTKAMELSQRLEKDIKEENWTEAQVNAALLKGAILGPLKEGATTPPKYLDVKGKKYKLVGEEPDEDKAAIWAANMEKSGEKIIVMPLLGRYSLYREE